MPAYYRTDMKDCKRKEDFSKGKFMLYFPPLGSFVFLERLHILVITKGLFRRISFSVLLQKFFILGNSERSNVYTFFPSSPSIEETTFCPLFSPEVLKESTFAWLGISFFENKTDYPQHHSQDMKKTAIFL